VSRGAELLKISQESNEFMMEEWRMMGCGWRIIVWDVKL